MSDIKERPVDDYQEISLPIEESGLKPEWVLNPMQYAANQFRGKKGNMMVVARTAAGKTTVIRMRAFPHLYPKNGKDRRKLVYVAPMKALVEEKKRDWRDDKDPYSKFNVAVITGDYVGAYEKEEKYLDEAEIVVITPESLASRLRNRHSARNRWLDDIGLLCIDEIHLIGSDRGASLEAALLEFSAAYPEIEILGLSATMPNVNEVVEWMASLNQLDTFLVTSDYRPTVLNMHFVKVEKDAVEHMEQDKIDRIIKRHRQFPDDQFLVCVFKKTFGVKIEKALKAARIDAEFHNADKDKQERANIEARFLCNDLRTVICTSTLFVGMNMPARRVIVTAVSNGGGDVPASDLLQAAGRAGRPQFDPEGDVDFYLPAKQDEFDYHKQRIINGENIESQMSTPAQIALHFLGAINLERICTHEDFYLWFKRTLRQQQKPLDDEQMKALLDRIIEDMTKRSMIRDKDGILSLKRRGLISSQMSLDPYYLYDLIANFRKYFLLTAPADIHLASALASCGVFYKHGVSKAVREETPPIVKDHVAENYWEAATVYHALITGKQPPRMMYSLMFQVKSDIDRIAQCLLRADKEAEAWEEQEKLLALAGRVQHGASWDVGRLMGEGATRSQAQLLAKAGINSMTLQRNPKYETIFAQVMNRGNRD